MKKATIKKIGKIVVNVLLYLFLAICIFSVLVTVLSKKDSDGAAKVFGHEMRIVTSDSMAKCEFTDVSDYKIKDIPVRSMVFVKTVPEDPAKADEFYRSLKVGDVLTFRYVYKQPVTITHRITSITKKETGGYIIELEGDNKNGDVNQLKQMIDTSDDSSGNYVVGKVKFVSILAGKLISIVKSPKKLAYFVLTPFAIIIVVMLFKLKDGDDDNHGNGGSGKKKFQLGSYEMDDFQRSVAENEFGNGRW